MTLSEDKINQIVNHTEKQELMSISAYARHRGVTPEAVRYALKVKKIVKGISNSRRGVPYIIPEVADQEWVLKTQSANPGDGEDPTILKKARERKELADAELAELKVEKEKGKLLDAEEVRRDAFKTARIVRDQMLNIPDRLAVELASETDNFKIHKILSDEIRRALESLEFEEE